MKIVPGLSENSNACIATRLLGKPIRSGSAVFSASQPGLTECRGLLSTDGQDRPVAGICAEFHLYQFTDSAGGKAVGSGLPPKLWRVWKQTWRSCRPFLIVPKRTGNGCVRPT